MKLSFSTLGCPDWTFEDILARAPGYGFEGVGFRGLDGELDLTRVGVFAPERRQETLRRLRAAGLSVNILLTSARMMIAEPDALAASQQSAKDHIDLASDLECPSIRVFGGQIPVGWSRPAAIARCAERLRELGEHAEGRGVKVLIESHDDWVFPDILARALEATDHPAVGVLWDMHHPWRIGEVEIGTAWERLRRWIVSVDLKDSVEDFDARLGYRYVRTGEGELPLVEALTLLKRAGYDGWLALEWEKRWHPEIAEPEEVFPHFVRTVSGLLGEIE